MNKNFLTSTPKKAIERTLRSRADIALSDVASPDISCIETIPEETNRVLYDSGAVQIVTLTDREYKAILDLYANKNATSITTSNSPLAPELTMTEKVQRIQDYINSITPNRVDYDKKSPKLNIIAKLPLDKPGTVAGKSHKIRISMCPRTGKTIMERIDYTNPGPLNVEHSQPVLVETSSYMQLRNRKQLQPRTPTKTSARKHRRNLLRNEPQTTPNGTSALTVDSHTENLTPNESIEDVLINFAIKESLNVTIRTPRNNSQRKRKSPGVVLDDNIQLLDDDSVEIVSVETYDENKHPPKKQLRKKKPIEIIDLCSSPEMNTNGAQKNSSALRELNENAQQVQKPISNCPICFEPLKNDVSSTLCGHIFCTACIREAIKQSRQCPTCRKALSLKKIHPIYF